MKIEPIHVNDILRHWTKVRPRIAASVEEYGYSWTVDDVAEKLLSGHMQLWLLTDRGQLAGVVCSEIYDTSRGKTCGLPIVQCDSLADWFERFMDMIGPWAKEHGCKRFIGEGRFGWVRQLKNQGWRPVSVQIEKEI